MRKKGFTLLELVIAIGITSILLAISLPSLHSSSSYLRRLAAEANLLTWQTSGFRPNNDHYYHYETIKNGAKTSWSATTEYDESCSELVLTDKSQEPSSCWPK